MAGLATLRKIVKRSGAITKTSVKRLGEVLTIGTVGGISATLVGVAAIILAGEYFGVL
jgi:hypothetical protein